MNFLAHIFLSGKNEAVLIGNFIADSVSNKMVEKYPIDIQKGIHLHRKIDHFTDTHPKVKESTKLLNPAHGKYAPVLLDIFYDYFLIRNWERYSSKNFEDFTKRAYQILEANFEHVPHSLRKNLPAMIESNWLANYGKLEGIEFTVKKVMNRVSKPKKLENSIETIFDHFDEINEKFNVFFPELVEFSKLERKKLGIID